MGVCLPPCFCPFSPLYFAVSFPSSLCKFQHNPKNWACPFSSSDQWSNEQSPAALAKRRRWTVAVHCWPGWPQGLQKGAGGKRHRHWPCQGCLHCEGTCYRLGHHHWPCQSHSHCEGRDLGTITDPVKAVCTVKVCTIDSGIIFDPVKAVCTGRHISCLFIQA